MVDTQSRLRMYGCHYNYYHPRKPAKTEREIHKIAAAYKPQTIPISEHDCRAGYLREFTDQEEWRAFVLSHGMRKTAISAGQIHDMPKVKVRPTKLLKEVGECGSGRDKFLYPRALAADSIGDVYIADSRNNRVLVYNGHAVYKHTLGKGQLDFNEPTGVAVFPNDDLAVADRRNKRIRVLTLNGKVKFDIKTQDEPFSVSTDLAYNIVVSTFAGTLELYRRGGTFYGTFKISESPCPIVCSKYGEIVVSNTESKTVEFYDHEGTKVNEFKPLSSNKGLGLQNSGIALDDGNRIILCDSLNHTINIYTERGVLVSCHLGPTDDLGSVQACALGPEGHLSVVEYTANSRHCLKVFRYSDCECHLYHKSPADE